MLGDKPEVLLIHLTLNSIVDSFEQTFINAFESLPVHCLKPRPSGNRRKPTKGGAMAILKCYISC